MTGPGPLAEGVVHVWWAPLAVSAEVQAALEASLPAEERERARRFAVPARRREFVVARGILRAILTGYAGGSAPSDDVAMSLGHGGGLGVFAFRRGGEVGVDVEPLRPHADAVAVAARFFDPAESAAVRDAAPDQRDEVFLGLWTAKEALIKARRITDAGGWRRLLATPVRAAGAGGWSVTPLSLPAGYVGAVAGEGDSWRVVQWPWSPHDTTFGMR